VQLRAHGEPHAASCEANGDLLRIRLHDTARGIARGQAAVLYDGDTVLGSATISAVSRSRDRVPPGS
jgi:tRNA-specific 2-thiouridylase